MKKPPVLARAVERGLAPLRGRRAAHLLPRARMGGPMPWVMAIMVALTVLALGGERALANMAGFAQAGLDGGVTVQVVEADAGDRAAQAQRALEVLRNDPAVTKLRLVPEAELEQLVEPWLGGGTRGDVVPLPALIDVRLAGGADEATLDRLRDSLAQAAPDARVDAQADWLGPVFSAIETLRWLAIALVAMLVFTSAAAVWLAARNALDANRDTIEIVHLLGGNDAQIARVFQRSVLLDSAVGSAAGLALGIAALLLLGAQFAALESGMVSGGGLSRIDFAILAIVPVVAVAIALLTARLTVLRSLGRLL